MKLSTREIKEIRGIEERRTQNVYCLGQAREEYLRAEKQFRDSIAECDRLQTAMGERFLRKYGFDPEAEDFTFGPNGEILRLVEGEYVMAEAPRKSLDPN